MSANPPAEGPGPVAAITGTFTNPAATFEGLLRKPTWWLPYLLLILAVAASFFAATPKIDMERTVRESLEKRAEKTGQTMSPADVDRIAEAQSRMRWVGPPIFAFFTALILFVFATFHWLGAKAMGGELTFAGGLSVYFHACLASALKWLLAIPIAFTQANDSLTQKQAQHLVKSSLGAFLPEGTSTFVSSLASYVDVFGIATVVLLVIGFRRIKGLSAGAATAIPIVLYLFAALLGAGLASLGG